MDLTKVNDPIKYAKHILTDSWNKNFDNCQEKKFIQIGVKLDDSIMAVISYDGEKFTETYR